MFGETENEFLKRKFKDLIEAKEHAGNLWKDLLSKSPTFRHQVVLELDKLDGRESDKEKS